MDIEFISGMTSDFRPVSNFLDSHALAARDCLPPPLLDFFAIAKKDGEIIACCGASLARDDRLHLEEIYQPDERVQNLLQDRSRVCEIGRWFSVDSAAAKPVLASIINHLLSEGVTHALCELKPATIRRTRIMGLHFIETESQLLLEAVDPAEIDYYLSDPPRLYILELSSINWRS